MKEFYRSYPYQPTIKEKKRNRIKNYCNVGDNVCKCFIHFLNIHCYDCPLVKAPCPIHGNPLSDDLRDRKTRPDSERSMTISIHPMSKTDKLIQPVKSLFVRNYNTKNSYMCSSKESNKEMYKSRQIQTNFEDLKFQVGNYFLENTKSYAFDKTNRMKKLKQCFHSPCNSIAQKTQSQMSLKSNDVFKEAKKTRDVCVSANKTLKEEFFRNDNTDSGWYCSDKVDSSDYEKSFVKELTDSDFIPINERVKRNDLVNHNVFEVINKKDTFFKSKKNIPTFGPRFLFASFDSENEPNEQIYSQIKKEPEKTIKENKPFDTFEGTKNENEKKIKTSGGSSSPDKSQSDSSGSVYFTPFILMPAGMDSERENKQSFTAREQKSDKSVQVNDEASEKKEPSTPGSLPSVLNKQDASVGTDERDSGSTESRKNSVFSERETRQYASQLSNSKSSSQKSVEIHKLDFKSLVLEVVKQSLSLETEKTKTEFTQTDPNNDVSSSAVVTESTQTDKESNKFTFDLSIVSVDSELISKYFNPKVIKWEENTTNVEAVRNVGVQTVENPNEQNQPTFGPDILGDTSRGSNETRNSKKKLKDAASQTNPKILVHTEVQVTEIFKHKFPMAVPSVSSKGTQTSFLKAQSVEDKSQTATYSKITELLEAENCNYSIVSSFTSQESGHAVEKLAQCQKTYSDSELYDRKNKCKCSTENEMPLPPHTYYTKQSGFNATVSNEGGTCCTKTLFNIFDSSKVFRESTTLPDLNENNRVLEKVTEPLAVTRKDECNNTSLSDLSELANIINQHFDKMCDPPVEFCECQMKYVSRKDCGTMTDTNNEFLKALTVQEKKQVTVETQTLFDTDYRSDVRKKSNDTETQSLLKIQSLVLPNEIDHTSHVCVCKICEKSIKSVVVDVSTSTNNLQISEITKVSKVDAQTCYEVVQTKSIVNDKICMTTKLPSSILKEVEKTNRDESIKKNSMTKSNPPAKSPQTSYTTYKLKNENVQNKNIIPTPCPRKNVSFKSESKSQWCECSTSKEDKTVIDLTKVKSSNSATKRINQSQSLSNKSLKNPLPNWNSQTSSSRSSPRTDIYPSIPATPRSGSTKADSKTNQSVGGNESKSKGNKFVYSVTVSPNWPRGLMRTLQTTAPKNELSSDLSPKSTIWNSVQKRNLKNENDTDDETPHGKRIKCKLEHTSDVCQEKFECSKECFVFGKAQFDIMPRDSDLKILVEENPALIQRKRKTLGKNGGFVWVPSLSTPEISVEKGNSFWQFLKSVKSENKFKESIFPKEKTNIKGLCNLFTTKSLHERPTEENIVTKKLFECSFCKSLTYLKTSNQNEIFDLIPPQSYKSVENKPKVEKENLVPTFQTPHGDFLLLEETTKSEEFPTNKLLFYEKDDSASVHFNESQEDRNFQNFKSIVVGTFRDNATLHHLNTFSLGTTSDPTEKQMPTTSRYRFGDKDKKQIFYKNIGKSNSCEGKTFQFCMRKSNDDIEKVETVEHEKKNID